MAWIFFFISLLLTIFFNSDIIMSTFSSGMDGVKNLIAGPVSLIFC